MIDLKCATWRKSQRSNSGDACVEVANLADGVAVRDSKNPAGDALAFDRAGWKAFSGKAKAGQFDR